MNRCVIISAGKINDYSFIKKSIKQDDYIICADGGVLHARNMNITPNLCVGDFDSLDTHILKDVQCEIIRFPSVKNDTDTLIALKEAKKRGFHDILLLGATGGRLDHTYANLQVMLFAKQMGIEVTLLDENNISFFLSEGTHQIKAQYDYKLSVFAFDKECILNYIKGTKYTVENITITSVFPIGISNEFSSEYAEISIKQGSILIVLSKD